MVGWQQQPQGSLQFGAQQGRERSVATTAAAWRGCERTEHALPAQHSHAVAPKAVKRTPGCRASAVRTRGATSRPCRWVRGGFEWSKEARPQQPLAFKAMLCIFTKISSSLGQADGGQLSKHRASELRAGHAQSLLRHQAAAPGSARHPQTGGAACEGCRRSLA